MQGKNRDSDTENRLMDTAGEGEGEPNHDSTTEIYTLPCVKANGKLLYSAGSPAWGSVTTYRSGMGMGVGRKIQEEGDKYIIT